MSKSPVKAHQLRVVSYNVLSSSLASPEHFDACDAADLDPETRWEKIKQLLGEEMRLNSVICLQEISRAWQAKAFSFFQMNNYSLIHSGYGGNFSGYMGCSIAVPNQCFRVIDADVQRVSDIIQWPKENVTFLGRIFAALRSALEMIGIIAKQKSPWYVNAKYRSNTIVSVKLKDIEGEKDPVWVATYHMPCAYKFPKLMVMHSALATQHVEKLSLKGPRIFCGDFNFGPDHSAFKNITGASDEIDPLDFPLVPGLQGKWDPKVEPLKSAYDPAPVFTNYAKTSFGDVPFIGTLDHIFYSDHFVVKQTKELPEDPSSLGASLPKKDHPSDHLLIAADFEYK